MIISQMIALKLLAGASETDAPPIVIPAGGGHFLPGLAGVRAGKRKPQQALQAAEKVLDEVVAEVLDTPERPVERVSRRMKSQIIEIATQRLLSERVLIGEVDAIDRAAAKLAKLAVKRRIEARKFVPVVVPIIPEIIPDTDQAIATLAFQILNQPDTEEQISEQETINLMLAMFDAKTLKNPAMLKDEELILLMQILLML